MILERRYILVPEYCVAHGTFVFKTFDNFNYFIDIFDNACSAFW